MFRVYGCAQLLSTYYQNLSVRIQLVRVRERGEEDEEGKDT